MTGKQRQSCSRVADGLRQRHAVGDNAKRFASRWKIVPREGISLEALEFALDRSKIAAVIAMPNAQNPLGFTMSDENKKRLVKTLDRRSVPLIEDDVYGDLYYGDDRPLPAKAFDRSGNVMLCSSFTKTVAPGFRLGWVSPGRWHAHHPARGRLHPVGRTA